MTNLQQQKLALNGAERVDKSKNINRLRSAIQQLWTLLDNIETIQEMAGEDHALYQQLVMQELAQREALGICVNNRGHLMLEELPDDAT
ncbi:hypothetical protein [Pseudoalteromonas umbrosa]|uniref:hypothetical protein n=1 Tax=Pseudoalteromonas umbrosa TaxID=3048489 RepID=UPI0024C28135|nr:hypothetical protein [Pseudoalteromonas sp. B95]MDK1290113.1 hypothetical protein [Pseudoalteromonas sp. B95]